LEALHAGLEGRSRELEAKVGTLETLLSVAMSTNRKLKLKLDEMSVELDVARKVEVGLAVVIAEMGALTLVTLPTTSTRAKVLRHMHLHPHIGIT
jgi:alpha-D-ribose 1-methylphosphonate 5-triphosphate synthase subunit PhnG